MASPWKFLTRLISPRRQRKQDDAAIGVEPVAALSEQTVTPVGESVDQPTRQTPTPFVRTEPFTAEPKLLIQTGGDGRDTAQSDSERGAGTSDPATYGITATIASASPRDKPSAKVAPGKRRGRTKKIATVEGVEQPAEVIPKISDEIGLDQEIRMLRIQLTSKLRLQNAQLKKMLERFER
ncbi:hypothetical protein P6U16_26450 (plasmid) [Rhizobium sp. 32-5/1]|uniref:hypothetical protein n=1 Tax=Rhizobium sp. 32-5/1 TaxID=3019602 RepID=UPI00240D3E1A|nr:hypothetical protein [Rhizobium sp. 32-5/1]WEZ85573.1 hypothetical protein P6U16_26450 [Rhizobium sp. 32-5/1]